MENTRKALENLAKQVAEMRAAGEEVGKCCPVRINSGRFDVEWQKTKAVLEAGGLVITVVRPEAEQKADGAGTAAGGQSPVKDENEKAKGEKCAVGTNARRSNRWTSGRTKAKGPFEKQTRGVKRKVEKDFEDGDDGREDMKGERLA